MANLLAQEIPIVDWDELGKTEPWKATEVWEPEPEQITPVINGSIPSDAIVLFDGQNLDAWQKPQFKSEMAMAEQLEPMLKIAELMEFMPADWTVEDGHFFEVKPGTGAIETKEKFGSMQLHIEWLSPVDEGKEGQSYSNSGVFLMGLYEIQILNSHKNKTYSNGQASAVYKQHVPEVNASLPAGEWQTYDILFSAPVFDGDRLMQKAYVTVLHNGVVTQNHVELSGPTLFIGQTKYLPHESKRPLRLQDHGDKIRFRNIWIRDL